jgi:hypothetical protein
LAVALGLVLSGCADGSGLELNGKMFDWIGISPSALAARRDEPKLADRAPLVIPPDSARLPEPGSGQTVQTAQTAKAAPTVQAAKTAPTVQAAKTTPTVQSGTAWPEDPDQRKSREAQERERLHQAYCRGDMQWKDRALNPGDINVPKSPYGSCTLLGDVVISNVNKQ